MAIFVRFAVPEDTPAIAEIHKSSFPRQRDSRNWVASTIAAAPRLMACVLTRSEIIIGYIFWAQKAGIRPSAVLELEQIAVAPGFRNQGFGGTLIRDSLALVTSALKQNEQSVSRILVSTRADNAAQKLYTTILGASVEAELSGLYSGNEVFMVARLGDS